MALGSFDAASATSGRAELSVTCTGARSVVSRAYATSPLRLLLPGNHGRAAWVFTSSHGGGLVDGDRLAMSIEVGAGAAAYLTTQASTKIYRSPRGTAAEMTARVDQGGLLVIAPDPVVSFAGSRYRQRQRVDLDQDAGLVLVDWITSGRRASGERWAFDEYEARLEVRDREALVVFESLALRVADGSLLDRLGRFDVLAIAVIAGDALRDEARHVVRRAADERAGPLARQLVGAAALDSGGCVLRIAGPSMEQVGRTLRNYLDFVPGLLGDDPWTRKW